MKDMTVIYGLIPVLATVLFLFFKGQISEVFNFFKVKTKDRKINEIKKKEIQEINEKEKQIEFETKMILSLIEKQKEKINKKLKEYDSISQKIDDSNLSDAINTYNQLSKDKK